MLQPEGKLAWPAGGGMRLRGGALGRQRAKMERQELEGRITLKRK